MKTRYYLYAAALLLLAGCTAENLPEEHAGAPVPIGVAVTVTEPAGTRAASNIQDAKFDAGEAFYVQFAASKATVNNATYTTTATGLATLSSATQPYFQTGESSVTLNAFYPYVEGKQVTEETTSFSVEQDQSSAANYKKSDLMFATATVTKSGTSVTAPLNFSHKMAKIQVIANAGTGVSNITAVSIVSGNRTVALSGGNATLGALSDALSDGSPLTMYSDVTGAQSVNCAALLPPQDITNSDFIKVTTASDGAAVYRITKTLASGNTYTLVLDIDKAALGNTTIITGWNSQNVLTVSTSSDALRLGTMNMSAAYVGWLIGVNGCVYRTMGDATADGTTAVAMIVYVGAAGTADSSIGAESYRGLAVALTDASSGAAWYGTNESTEAYTSDCLTTAPNNTRSSTFTDYWNYSSGAYGKLEGIGNTEKLTGKKVGFPSISVGTACHEHLAANAAVNYNVAVPKGTSGWFLPSGGQWMKFFRSAGLPMHYWTAWGWCKDSSNTETNRGENFTKVNKMFTDAGATGFPSGVNYWSSSEYHATCAVFVYFNSSYGVYLDYNSKYGGFRVRAFLAF